MRIHVSTLGLTLATLAALLTVGVTYASWTDGEWAGGAYDVAEGTRFDLAITGQACDTGADVTTCGWEETSADNVTPDGAFETVRSLSAAKLGLTSNDRLYPGYAHVTTLYLRNDSSFTADLSARLLDVTGGTAGTEDLAGYYTLSFAVAVAPADSGSVGAYTPLAVTGPPGAAAGDDGALTIAGLAAADADLLHDGYRLAPGAIARVTLTLLFDAGQSLNGQPERVAALQTADPLGFTLRFASHHAP
jgi:hypothetical protein